MIVTVFYLLMFLGYSHGSIPVELVPLTIDNETSITTEDQLIVTTTEQPFDPPDPPILDFKLLDGDNITCLLARFSGEFRSLNDSGPGYSFNNSVIDKDRSFCGSLHSQLVIDWGHDNDTFLVHLQRIGDAIQLKGVAVTIDQEKFENSEVNLGLSQIGRSFTCDSGLEINLRDEEGRNLTLMLKHVKFDSFRNKFDPHFQPATVCSADTDGTSSTLIPKIVATVLALIVVVMVIGYVIHRRREKPEEDESTLVEETHQNHV